jgi:predicted permease
MAPSLQFGATGETHMGHILGVVLPLFAIIGLGKLAVHFAYLDTAGAAVLSRFAFLLLIPALLFGLVAEAPTADMFGPSGTYFVGCLIVYGIALWIARWLQNPSLSHGAVFALDSTFGNGVFLGTPLVLALYGTEGLSVLVGMILFTTILLPMPSILMELGGARGTVSASTIQKTIVDVLKNPAVNSVILGFLWHFTGWPGISASVPRPPWSRRSAHCSVLRRCNASASDLGGDQRSLISHIHEAHCYAHHDRCPVSLVGVRG